MVTSQAESQTKSCYVRILFLLAPVVTGLILATFVLQVCFGSKKTDFEDLALGNATSSLFCKYKGHPIHCSGVEDANSCIEGWHVRGEQKVALWLGNSQVHAVNQLKSGQENAPPILFRHLHKNGIDLLTFSEPNASLQEHYVLFEHLKHRLPVQLLIISLVFDDLRETGLRSGVALALDDAGTVAALETTEIGRKILDQNKDLSSIEDDDLAGIRNTIQEHSESVLNEWLSEHSELWALRPEARGNLFNWLYRLRNTVFGITAQSKRKMIRSRYDANISAFVAILDRAAQSDISVLAYIVPIRDDVEVPYVQEEYEIFKQEAEQLVRGRGAVLCNLESLVPAYLWGTKGSTRIGGRDLEIDFMHFQAPGHELLAETLAQLIDSKIHMEHH